MSLAVHITRLSLFYDVVGTGSVSEDRGIWKRFHLTTGVRNELFAVPQTRSQDQHSAECWCRANWKNEAIKTALIHTTALSTLTHYKPSWNIRLRVLFLRLTWALDVIQSMLNFFTVANRTHRQAKFNMNIDYIQGVRKKKIILRYSAIKSEISIPCQKFRYHCMYSKSNGKTNDVWHWHSCSTFQSAQVVSISGTAPRWSSEPPHAHAQRRITSRSERLLVPWRSTLSLYRSRVAWSAPWQARCSPSETRYTSSRARWARNAPRHWTRDDRRQPSPLRTTAPSSHVCSCPLVSACDELVSCMDGGAGLRRRIVFSEVRFSPEPRARCLTNLSGLSRTDCCSTWPESLLWADRARSAAALSCFLRNSLAPWSSPICWWWHYLVPGESFCDPSRVFGQAVGGTRQTICWKCTFPRKTPYPHLEVSQILLFCIHPFCHVLIYKYDKFQKKSTHALWKRSQNGEYLFFQTPCIIHRDIYLEMACIQICGISVGLFKHMNLPFDSL